MKEKIYLIIFVLTIGIVNTRFTNINEWMNDLSEEIKQIIQVVANQISKNVAIETCISLFEDYMDFCDEYVNVYVVEEPGAGMIPAEEEEDGNNGHSDSGNPGSNEMTVAEKEKILKNILYSGRIYSYLTRRMSKRKLDILIRKIAKIN